MDRDLPAELLPLLLEQGSFLFFLLEPDGRIAQTTRRTDEALGLELVGARFQDLLVGFGDHFDLAQATQSERLLTLHSSRELPESFRFHFVPAGEMVIACGFVDHEENRFVNQETLRLTNELSNLSRELHKKNAQLQMLNQEKNRFLGMAAHDLRKPIGIILSYADFLGEDLKDRAGAEQLDFVERIQKSCLFMKQLVDDFLDVSAIESGTLELHLESLPLRDLLDESLDVIHYHGAKHDVQLKLEVQEGERKIHTDVGKISQVIINLASNAIDFSDAGGTVALRFHWTDDGLRGAVHDEGPGIAPEEIDRLFRPFRPGEVKKKSGERSTGLGLVISRKVIEAHGGRIWVESELNRGTTVRFTVPQRRKTP